MDCGMESGRHPRRLCRGKQCNKDLAKSRMQTKTLQPKYTHYGKTETLKKRKGQIMHEVMFESVDLAL